MSWRRRGEDPPALAVRGVWHEPRDAAPILRGVSVGENAVIGTSSVVTTNVPANAVVAGVPARILRMRKAPKTFRWA